MSFFPFPYQLIEKKHIKTIRCVDTGMKGLQYLVKYNLQAKCLGRKIGLFRLHIKNTKKLSLQSKYKYAKSTMVTGIAQKKL